MRTPAPGPRLLFLGLPGDRAGELAALAVRDARRAVRLRTVAGGPPVSEAAVGSWELVRRRPRQPRPEPGTPRPSPYKNLRITVLPALTPDASAMGAQPAGHDGLVVVTGAGERAWWERRLLFHHVQRALADNRAQRIVLAVTGLGRRAGAAELAEAVRPWASYLGSGASAGRLYGVTVPVRFPGGARGTRPGVPLLWHLGADSELTPRQRRLTDARLAEARTSGSPLALREWERVDRVLHAAPVPPDRTVRVTVVGAPGAGRTTVLAAAHRVLGPERPGLWLHLPDPGALHDLITRRRAREEGTTPSTPGASSTPGTPGLDREHWHFQLADGTVPVMDVDWLEADTRGARPDLADRVRDSQCVIVAVDAGLLDVPLDEGRTAELRERTGAATADELIQAAATFHRDADGLPPQVVLLLTGVDRLLRDGRPLRTRAGLLDDFRRLVPAAFAPGVLTALCPVSAGTGETDPPTGVEAPYWLLLLQQLRREAHRLTAVAAGEEEKAERLRERAERRKETTSRWNPVSRVLGFADGRRADRGEGRARAARDAAAANGEIEKLLHRDLRDTTVLLGGEPYGTGSTAGS
ncbi:hypothetical protein [Streptomyces antibioticus]|uniref:hypothetical protein n=1 Tax=Streptomyces antibioticus TaxID=1890 RepID=UPI0033B0BDC0